MKTIKRIKVAIALILIPLGFISCGEDDIVTNLLKDPQQIRVELGTHKLETYSQINNTEYLVVFESGLGDGHSVWFEKNILEEIGDLSDVLLYDRAGYENSEVGPGPRDIERLSSELETVVNLFSNGRKVILVCHSIGGLIARDFAIKNPDKMASILFIDPSHESYNNPTQEIEDWGYDLFANAYGENHGAPMEYRELIEDIAYAYTLPDLPNIPVTVLTSMNVEANADNDEINNASRAIAFAAQGELGEGIADFTHVGVESSGHYVMREEPNLVIEHIKILLSK
ncbi:alpha/beta fold hydrolase [Flavivirga spongiicola]|uniref:Alpha/beta hydrolase n=1 Tax=Flavivirga spongiicola TaxID=421621 RepID=A0ABU7XYX3_9FLAO|nr:alpha/beta hydrolase [Flavivirga sp. MEBiC05379]MDO5980991.1 alpha/beta hydrolase [Flavivirga sp. MEBiC05379]